MKILLDTHVFIWIDTKPACVSAEVQSAMDDPDFEVLLSVVSLWEITVKQSIGKLKLNRALSDAVKHIQDASGLVILPVTQEHVWPLATLPMLHNDPFDRLLIAQAIAEGLTFASADRAISGYPVSILR